MKNHVRIFSGFSVVAVLAALSLAACSPTASLRPDQGAATATVDSGKSVELDAEGEIVVGHLSERYANLAPDCGSPARPAVLCSGIMIRGTNYSEAYDSWVPNPSSAKAPGVSFSYLRADSRYRKLAYGYTHGFITYPLDYTPQALVKLEVLCVFTVDSDTDQRGGMGCGAHAHYPQDSRPCVAQGITTLGAWLAHYRKYTGFMAQEHECGFDVSIGAPDSAKMFALAISAMAPLRQLERTSPRGEVSFEEQNELVVRGWGDETTRNKIGIEAFFYIAGTQGHEDARRDQLRFHTVVGVWRPVIRITLPVSPAGHVRFAYSPADQWPAD